MFNILLDKLPTEYKGFHIDSDFQTGIQITNIMGDPELLEDEKFAWALYLLFPGKDENDMETAVPDVNTAVEGLEWFLTDWIHDNLQKSSDEKRRVTDFDIDQWRVYAAFRMQYGINLNRDRLHYWEFMGLLQNLEECAYTRVVDIRRKKISSKMSPEERKVLRKAKEIYRLPTDEDEMSAEEAEAVHTFRDLVKSQRK